MNPVIMADELKKYIDSYRAEFEDSAEELDGLWLGIASKLEPRERRFAISTKMIWRVAAVTLVFIGLTWLVLVKPYTKQGENISKLYMQSPELAEAEGYYSAMIETRMEQINNYRDRIDPQIFDDLEALDQAMKELENDLSDNIDNQEVINAMIKNYRIKLEILERIQAELEQNENEEIQS